MKQKLKIFHRIFILTICVTAFIACHGDKSQLDLSRLDLSNLEDETGTTNITPDESINISNGDPTQVTNSDASDSDASEVVFHLNFEKYPYAIKSGGNPYPIGKNFELIPKGKSGSGWTNTAKDGFIGFAGDDNIPIEKGTVSMWVKSDYKNIFNDGVKRTFVSLPRTIEGMTSDSNIWKQNGLALSLRKTEMNTLDLIVHIGGDSKMYGSIPITVISEDISNLPENEWHHFVFSWDFNDRKLWLIINGKEHEADIPKDILNPHKYLAIIFGNTEDRFLINQEPLDAIIDDITILNESYPNAGGALQRSYNGTPQILDLKKKAEIFTTDASLSRIEEMVRTHLDLLVDTQRHGGWQLMIMWPSLLQYNGRFRLPAPKNMIGLTKDNQTAFGAAELLWAYETLGDKKYLDAAVKTGEMYLETQSDKGYWVYGYYYEDNRYIPATSDVSIQDHVQTGPISFLTYLYIVTGDERYLNAAKKNADFLVNIQNPNGSWSHHYDPIVQQSLSSTGDVGGGEINDYGTSAPVEALLELYKVTGDTKYRSAALKGASWIENALIENDTVIGWAGQYNANNKPIEARHFEPVSVTQLGIHWAARGLLAAYRETKNEKFLEPLKKTLDWLDRNKVGNGWWFDYDISTGRPIAMWQRQIYFLDDSQQIKNYVNVSGRKLPTPTNDINYDAFRRVMKDTIKYPAGLILEIPTKGKLIEYVSDAAPIIVQKYIEGGSSPVDSETGLYLFEGPSGLYTNLVRHQVIRGLNLLMRARAARGDIPLDQPQFKHNKSFVGWHQIHLH